MRYCGLDIGPALVDDDQEILQDIPYLSVRLPKGLRRYAHHRPDVVIAMLNEDSEARTKIKPFVSIAKTQVSLPHLVLRNELARIVIDYKYRSGVGDLISKHVIDSIRRGIGRVIFVNDDHTDCRLENLRELAVA